MADHSLLAFLSLDQTITVVESLMQVGLQPESPFLRGVSKSIIDRLNGVVVLWGEFEPYSHSLPLWAFTKDGSKAIFPSILPY